MYCTWKYVDVHKYGVLAPQFPWKLEKESLEGCSNICTWKSVEIIKCTWIYTEILLLYVDVYRNSGVRGSPWISM